VAVRVAVRVVVRAAEARAAVRVVVRAAEARVVAEEAVAKGW
jgi:hypothetical protein